MRLKFLPLLLLLIAPRAWATGAISYDATSGHSGAVNDDGTATGAVNINITIVAGETAFCAIWLGANNGSSMTGITGGGNWSQIKEIAYDSSTNESMSIWTNGAGGGIAASTITAAYSNTTGADIFYAFCGQYFGIGSVLTGGSVTASQSSSTTPMTISLTTTKSNSWMIAMLGTDGVPTIGSAATGNLRSSNTNFMGLMDNTVTSPSSVTCALNLSAGTPWNGIAVEVTTTTETTAIPVTSGQGTNAAIAFEASSGHTATGTTALTCTLGSTWGVGYTGIMIIAVRSTAGTASASAVTAVGGTWTQIGTIANVTPTVITTMWATGVNLTTTAPSGTPLVVISGTSTETACAVGAYSGIGSILTAGLVTSAPAASATETIALTTTNTGSWVIAGFGTADDSNTTLVTGNLRESTKTGSGTSGIQVALNDNKIFYTGSVTNSNTITSSAWSGIAVEVTAYAPIQWDFTTADTGSSFCNSGCASLTPTVNVVGGATVFVVAVNDFGNVTSITGGGTWARIGTPQTTAGTTTELWSTTTGGATTASSITINFNGTPGSSSAVVTQYTGITTINSSIGSGVIAGVVYSSDSPGDVEVGFTNTFNPTTVNWSFVINACGSDYSDAVSGGFQRGTTGTGEAYPAGSGSAIGDSSYGAAAEGSILFEAAGSGDYSCIAVEVASKSPPPLISFDATAGHSGGSPSGCTTTCTTTVTMVAGETGIAAIAVTAGDEVTSVTGGGTWTKIVGFRTSDNYTDAELWTNGVNGGSAATSVVVNTTSVAGVGISVFIGQYTGVASITTNTVTSTALSSTTPFVGDITQTEIMSWGVAAFSSYTTNSACLPSTACDTYGGNFRGHGLGGGTYAGQQASLVDISASNYTVLGALGAEINSTSDNEYAAAMVELNPWPITFDWTSGHSGSGAASSSPVSVTTTIVSGETGICVVGLGNGSTDLSSQAVTSITGGGTWTRVAAETESGGTNGGCRIELWTNGVGGGAAATSVSVAYSPSVSYAAVSCGQYVGVTGILVVNAVGNSATASPSVSTPLVNLTTVDKDSFVVAGLSETTSSTPAPGTSFGALRQDKVDSLMFVGLNDNPSYYAQNVLNAMVDGNGATSNNWTTVAVELTSISNTIPLLMLMGLGQ